jgi:hypothetical protein
MPKIDPIRMKISPDFGLGSANEWGCSYRHPNEAVFSSFSLFSQP